MLNNTIYYFATIGTCAFSTFVLYKIYEKQKIFRLRKIWNNAEKNVVVLHQFKRGKVCPNASPFALKVETFLRVANIKYIVDEEIPMGTKGKCPWITINGEDVPDSEFIITKLKDMFKINLDQHITETENAKIDALRIMAEEHLLWCYAFWRYAMDKAATLARLHDFGWYLNLFIKLRGPAEMKKRANAQGIGRHSEKEILHIAERDCEILSIILGDSDFFGGKSPCVADCALFAMLAQFFWNSPGSPYEQFVKVTYKNLGEYCERMKKRAFPDWDLLLK